MPLEIRKNPDGTLREYWYGRYEINGKRYCDNLGVKIAGRPPVPLSLRKEGDGAFERSRQAAKDKLTGIIEEARTKRDSTRLMEKIYEIKTGAKIISVKLADLTDGWSKLLRSRKPNQRYASQCRSTLARFVAFVSERYPKTKELGSVTQGIARAFMDAEATRGVKGKTVTAKTWNDTLKLLRATCKHLLPPGNINPFEGIPTRETDIVFRKPFMPDELRQLLDTARPDEFMFPLITAAACTGMRRGDLCILQWSNVDLKEGILSVKTSKTGAEIEIPIFKPLWAILDERKNNKSKYVFPEAAQMLKDNPDGLTWRFKKIVAHAFSEKKQSPAQPALLSQAEAESSGMTAIKAKIPEGERLNRILDNYRRYVAGESIRQIVKATGRPKGTISGDLHIAQDIIGKPLIREQNTLSITDGITRITRVDRKQGQRSASIWDWHALRSTFVTLALSAGISEEIVRRITGHATVEIIRKHYFRPNRDQFKAALSVMPSVLTGGKVKKVKPADELAALAGKVAAGIANDEDKKRLRKLAVKVK